jgi:hypothetical protein
MPVAGLTGRVRALREAKLKLGYVKRGKRFPSDTDNIIGKADDGITKDIVDAYGGRPVPDAEPGVYSLGRAVRGLIPGEFDLVGPDGREVWLEILNRAWGKSRIRCSGDGGGGGVDESGISLVGEAWVRDETFRRRFERAGLLKGDRPGAGWVAECRGPDCPLWHTKATDDDKLPACHREMRFRFVLLHPAAYDRTRSLDAQSDDYLRQLAWVEVATGSWNGAIDVQSGLTVIRAMAGKTSMIPFTLRRVRRSVSTPEGRVFKDTLMVTFDADEVLIMAGGGGARALLRPGLRRQLAEIAEAEGRAGLLEPRFEDVADIQPQPDRQALPAPAIVHPPRPADREDALEGAQAQAGEPNGHPESAAGPAAGPDGDAPPRLLGREELNRLKEVSGGKPGDRSTLHRYRDLLEQSYQALGVPLTEQGELDRTCREWRPYPGTPAGAWPQGSWCTTRHRAWIEERLAQEGQQTDLLDEDDG